MARDSDGGLWPGNINKEKKTNKQPATNSLQSHILMIFDLRVHSPAMADCGGHMSIPAIGIRGSFVAWN
jgi:hypothetical protein